MTRRHQARRGTVFPAVGPKSFQGRKAARDAIWSWVFGLALGYVIVAIEFGEFFYRNDNGQIERAFCIRPWGVKGHDVYIDFYEGVVVHEWVWSGYYRVTPWMRFNAF